MSDNATHKLVKREDRYDLYDESTGQKIASTAMQGNGKRLSTENCEAIENGYDLDELAKLSYKCDPYIAEYLEQEFKRGFQKALEILGDKKFSEEQLRVAADWYVETKGKKSIDEYIQSLQQSEWEVEIVTEQIPCSHGSERWETIYVKDKDGCLIIKRK